MGPPLNPDWSGGSRPYIDVALPAKLILCATCVWSLVGAGSGFVPGFDTITEAELERDVRALASPDFEGRDTPSVGLERAARWIEERFKKAGLGYAPDSSVAWKKVVGTELPSVGADAKTPGASVVGTFRRPFERHLPAPEPNGCGLAVEGGDASSKAPTYELRRDFVPVHGCEGEAAGEIVFAGYGIQSKTEKYDDFSGLKIKGRIALIVEGEPRTTHRRFDGVEISRAASLWEKIDALFTAGAAGVLAARRPSLAPPPSKDPGKEPGKDKAAPASTTPDPDADLSFRSTWAEFNGVASDPPPKHPLPALEVSLRCASDLLGQDVEALAERIDKAVHPVHVPVGARKIRMRSRTSEIQVRVDNL